MTQHLVRCARRSHRKVLVQLVQFWQTLSSKRPDINRLEQISRYIYKQRKESLDNFQQLLSGATINPMVFRQWGLFTETVLEEPEMATRIYIEARLLQDTDQRKREFARRAIQEDKADEDEMLDLDMGPALSMPEDVIHCKKVRLQKETGVTTLVLCIRLGFLALLLLVVGSCVVSFLYSQGLEKIVLQVH